MWLVNVGLMAIELQCQCIMLQFSEYKGKVDVPIRITPSVLHMDPLPTMAGTHQRQSRDGLGV